MVAITPAAMRALDAIRPVGGMVGRYTRGESAGSALRYL